MPAGGSVSGCVLTNPIGLLLMVGIAPLSTLIIYRSGWCFARGVVPLVQLIHRSSPLCGLLGDAVWIGWVNLRGNSLSSTFIIYTSARALDRV